MIANSNLFEKFALLGGADAYVYSLKTKELETVFENCNTLELTAKGDKVDIKEKGNIVMSIPKALTTDLKFTAETTSFSKLAMALGSAGFVLNTEADNYTKDEVFEVTDTTTITHTLSTEAVDVSSVRAFLITTDGELVKALVPTLDATKKIVTITADPDIAVGDRIRINYDSVVAVGKMYQFKVPTKSNQGAKKVVIDAIGINRNTQEKVLMQIEIYRVAVAEGITITMDGEKQSSFDISMTVLADYSQETEEEGSQFFRYKVLTEA